ncbi:MAG: SH3 domain-containing protein, partial [Pseudomonadota bacterium]
ERVDPTIDTGLSAQPGDEIQIHAADLRDMAHASPFPKVGKFVGRLGMLAGVLAVGTMLFFTLQPNVTAYDIISMDDYQGQQKPEWTLDPQQVSECESLSECFKKELALKSNNPQTESFKEIPASNSEWVIVVDSVEPVVDDVITAIMIVSKKWSNIRQQPGMQGAIISSIDNGREVEVLDRQSTWFEIRTLGGGREVRGFMHENTLQAPR